MMQEINNNEITWIHFTNLDDEDILYLQEKFNIPPIAIEDFVMPTIRPKTTSHENCLFLTLLVPLFDTTIKTTYSSEVNFILTKTHIITGTGKNDTIFQLNSFFETLKENKGKRKIFMSDTPAHLFRSLLEMLLESCFPRIDNITKKINTIEHNVFQGNEKAMVREISFIKRDILNFRKTLMPQRAVLESLANQKTQLLPTPLLPFFHELTGVSIRIWNTLENNKETIESLEKTNESLLSFKINDKMRIITIFSTILLPTTLYANIFGMNTGNVPLVESSVGFWTHLFVMVCISFFTYLLFKLRKWI